MSSSASTVLVTGSSRGIGRAIALRLAREGYDLVLHCRSRREQAEAVANEITALGRSVQILQFDVADRLETRATLEAMWRSMARPMAWSATRASPPTRLSGHERSGLGQRHPDQSGRLL